ncbi:MAG TPA: ATP-binding protein [Verrucomicrobiae bacterium]|nr:ATP-binding protein [Verrucomicrobiae bacterium]
MKLGIQFRLIALTLTVALMGLLILLATLNSQRQADELSERLAQVDSESFRIADEFRNSMRELNNTLQRYGTERDPALWNEFSQTSHKLDGWIQEQKPKLTTAREEETLQNIGPAYVDYLRTARDLQEKIKTSGDAVPVTDFAPLRKASQHLFDLGDDLSKAHYESRKELLEHARQVLTQLRWSTFVSLALLFAFGLALAAVVYRDMIGPLRVKLVESQSLAERNEKLASLGMLAAGVAHEIRNPLTAVKAALYIQQKKFQPGSPERADIELVEREILRLERIVNDFLQFARPTDPKLVATPVGQVFSETQRLMAPQLTAANIQFNVQSPAPMSINMDAEQIKQVLINLVQNAADSIVGGGTITLSAREDRKRLVNGETNVVILEVADTGRGIPPEVQKRLFDPFFTTKESGTGLGLSIAARIVQNHGGALQYQTQVNHGTTFGIVLPEPSK